MLAVVVYAVYYWTRVRRLRTGAHVAVQHQCSHCSELLRIDLSALTPLSRTEKGLSVSSDARLVGVDLRSHRCPHCESIQIFAMRDGRADFVGADMFTPQGAGDHCLECRRVVTIPPWEPGTYDGKFDEAPGLSADMGVACDRCGALVCFGCAKGVTRKRADDGSYQCPRCSRMSIDQFFHGPGTSKYVGA